MALALQIQTNKSIVGDIVGDVGGGTDGVGDCEDVSSGNNGCGCGEGGGCDGDDIDGADSIGDYSDCGVLVS